MRAALRARFLVFLRDGGSFSGLLVDVDDRTAMFTDVKLVQAHGTLPADGTVFVDRARIAYLQDGG
ncbi:hypothetical protein [Kutzneria chonburiensis]|uniref:LSM domain-containing protein n=1 Tax=Kutzneria chonburiensis TaxID=1483604 RepID=A0ABV6N2W2_9PSEU|nr:hypothetical protein [Kutzneria chonburiensis]